MRLSILLTSLFLLHFTAVAAERLKEKTNNIVIAQSIHTETPSGKIFTSRNDRFRIKNVRIEGGNDKYFSKKPGK